MVQNYEGVQIMKFGKNLRTFTILIGYIVATSGYADTSSINILNPSFELDNVNNPPYYIYSITDWTITGAGNAGMGI